MNNLQNTAAIYLRVSTEKQELENQLGPLKNLAQAKRLQVVDIYKDIASGIRNDREDFNRMMRDAHKGKFKIIIVWALDRLSREGLSKTINLIEHLNHIGVGVISYTEPYLDTTNELAKNILLAVISTLAKAEREKISERTKAALVRLKNQGKKLGRPGLSEKIKQKVFKLKKQRLSMREIARTLGISHASVIKILSGNKRGTEISRIPTDGTCGKILAGNKTSVFLP
ncbi:MAG: recombinase family protein [Elusimicrobiota bacterium]|nr:recombinase family protein [Elusimicrobiota bacterium]